MLKFLERRSAWTAGAILGVLAACASGPVMAPAPVDTRPPPAPVTASAPPLQRANARWVPVSFTDLPGWDADRSVEWWPALLRGCERPPLEWVRLCVDARKATPGSDAAVRAWLQQRLLPYRVESLEGASEGLVTGYFEPLVEARRNAQGAFRVPLYQQPADLATRRPFWTRQQVDTLAAAQTSLRGRELAFVADPLDSLILQIQGSGRLHLTDADGSRKLVRAAFAGHNDQPYKSVGRWLIEQGELKPEQASWPAIKAWARMNPKRLNELLWSNPRVVFFREEPLSDPALGPRGAQGVPLTPGRSIAVDAQSVPYGTPVWLDTTEPLASSPLRRLVMAQDTGSAITGAVRADYFWGWGEPAEQQAGRMKQVLRMWVLWPRN
jgi:membrane-bound lytic murein transglycosylase A